MRRAMLIAAREYNAAVRTKAFIIGIVMMPVLMFGSILAMVFLEQRVDTGDKTIAVVDRSGVIAPAIGKAAKERNSNEIKDKTGKKTAPAYLIEVVKPNDADPKAQQLELSNRVRNRELHAFVEIGRSVGDPAAKGDAAMISYHAENSAMDDVRGWIETPINDEIRRLRLQGAGVDATKVDRLLQWRSVESMGLVSVDKSTGKVKEAERTNEFAAFLVPFAMLMLLFMMIMMGTGALLNSTLEEKTQRIAEVLLGSAKPFEIMMGKLIGNLGVSFTAAAVYIGGSIIGASQMGALGQLPLGVLPWFVVYLVTGVFMFGAVYIAVGAAVNDAKEAQSLVIPVMMPLMIPMFVMVPVLKAPNSGFAMWMSLIPPFTPMVMTLRQSSPGGVPAWQPWVGLLGVVAFTVLLVWAAGRIFRVGLLMQGKAPSMRELAKWAISG